jgi:O-antigen ligase
MAYWRVYPEVRPPNGDLPGTFGALHPHDAYLSLAGETGALGLVAAGYGWVRFGRAAARGLRLHAGPGGRLSLGVCAGLLAVLVQGIFDTIGVVDMAFVWIPYTALALAAAEVDVFGEAVHP